MAVDNTYAKVDVNVMALPAAEHTTVRSQDSDTDSPSRTMVTFAQLPTSRPTTASLDSRPSSGNPSSRPSTAMSQSLLSGMFELSCAC